MNKKYEFLCEFQMLHHTFISKIQRCTRYCTKVPVGALQFYFEQKKALDIVFLSKIGQFEPIAANIGQKKLFIDPPTVCAV